MSIKELVQDLESLNEVELQEVATYVSFLKFRKRRTRVQSLSNGVNLAQLYAEFADEDRQLAEDDMTTYYATLATEDAP